MTDHPANGVWKIHPATRPMEVEDPLELHGWQVPGDPALMLRLLTEEFARMGWTAERIVLLGHDPFYQAFYALRKVLGDEQFAGLVHQTLRRCGRARATVTERAAEPEPQLVTIQMANSIGHHGSDQSDRSDASDLSDPSDVHRHRNGQRRRSHGTSL